ncbi:hypothetical protein BC835DRAFT_1310207 [Cytidiella melzeri]|nr:hypothetical protein BC835DRAFT_1310207 [Cytidiella melzeri]
MANLEAALHCNIYPSHDTLCGSSLKHSLSSVLFLGSFLVEEKEKKWRVRRGVSQSHTSHIESHILQGIVHFNDFAPDASSCTPPMTTAQAGDQVLAKDEVAMGLYERVGPERPGALPVLDSKSQDVGLQPGASRPTPTPGGAVVEQTVYERKHRDRKEDHEQTFCDFQPSTDMIFVDPFSPFDFEFSSDCARLYAFVVLSEHAAYLRVPLSQSHSACVDKQADSRAQLQSRNATTPNYTSASVERFRGTFKRLIHFVQMRARLYKNITTLPIAEQARAASDADHYYKLERRRHLTHNHTPIARFSWTPSVSLSLVQGHHVHLYHDNLYACLRHSCCASYVVTRLSTRAGRVALSVLQMKTERVDLWATVPLLSCSAQNDATPALPRCYPFNFVDHDDRSRVESYRAFRDKQERTYSHDCTSWLRRDLESIICVGVAIGEGKCPSQPIMILQALQQDLSATETPGLPHAKIVSCLTTMVDDRYVKNNPKHLVNPPQPMKSPSRSVVVHHPATIDTARAVLVALGKG